MTATLVLNLSTGEELIFGSSTPPIGAVIAAYAQSHGDHNSWDYQERYSHLVQHGTRSVACGDFTAIEGGTR